MSATLASLAVGLALRQRGGAPEGPRTPHPVGRRAAWLWRAGRDIYALARDRDAAAAPPSGVPEADLVEARLIGAQWQGRAEASERRVAELEARLAASEMTALDLRSRLVCLHGKLATTAATARYQSMAMALEQHHPDAVDPMPQPHA